MGLEPKEFGIVHFDSHPRGADIIVDGQILIDPNTEESIKTPATVRLYEGRHDFIMRLIGSNDTTGYVDVLPGVRVDIFRNFEPGTPGGGEHPEPQIWLSNMTNNTGAIGACSFPYGADIYIDGIPVTDQLGKIVQTPATIIDVPVGMRLIKFTMFGMKDEMKIIYISPGRRSDICVTMKQGTSSFS